MKPFQNTMMAGDLTGCLNNFGDSPNLVEMHNFSRKSSLLQSTNVGVHDQIGNTNLKVFLIQMRGRHYSGLGEPSQKFGESLISGLNSKRPPIKDILLVHVAIHV